MASMLEMTPFQFNPVGLGLSLLGGLFGGGGKRRALNQYQNTLQQQMELLRQIYGGQKEAYQYNKGLSDLVRGWAERDRSRNQSLYDQALPGALHPYDATSKAILGGGEIGAAAPQFQRARAQMNNAFAPGTGRPLSALAGGMEGLAAAEAGQRAGAEARFAEAEAPGAVSQRLMALQTPVTPLMPVQAPQGVDYSSVLAGQGNLVNMAQPNVFSLLATYLDQQDWLKRNAPGGPKQSVTANQGYSPYTPTPWAPRATGSLFDVSRPPSAPFTGMPGGSGVGLNLGFRPAPFGINRNTAGSVNFGTGLRRF